MARRIMRIPRADTQADAKGDGFVLISAESTGPDDLDIQITGTEDEHPYTARCLWP